MDKTIGLIACYLGPLPWYFGFFIHSCKYNPSVDFFILIDDTSSMWTLPSNVHIIYQTKEDISILLTERLKLEISIHDGYKLCDFKPTYGIVFSDLLYKYDFWGHTDIDIIYGDIRHFITCDLLETFDLISVRPDWLTGCFLLYKNNDRLNTLFMHSKDYKKVFTSAKHYCFDETNFAHDAFSQGKNYLSIETEIESMMHVVKKAEAKNYIKPYFDLHIIEGLPGKLSFEKGKMFYRNKYEILLYHMVLFKNIAHRLYTDFIPESFKISATDMKFRNRVK
jgi:hypothetical protein